MFENYLPMGDSMTIDFYAASDAHAKGHEELKNVGAASLLFQNNDKVFPEFEHNDLRNRYPGIKLFDMSFDGATIGSLLHKDFQEKLAPYEKSKNLITITIGGNDLLEALQTVNQKKANSLQSKLNRIQTDFIELMKMLQKKCSQSDVIVTTLYDPTDDTGIMPCARELYPEFDIKHFTAFNQFVRDTTISHGFNIADVYWHFMGHGAMCGKEENFWYWKPHPIEPGLTGASEIRRVWLDVIDRF